MKRSVRLGNAMALGFLLVTLIGCTSQGAQLTDLNNWMAETNHHLARAAWDFRKKLEPVGRGDPANIDDLKASVNNLRGLVQKAKEEWKVIKVPDVPVAQELHKAYGAFLDVQGQLVEQEFPTIVRWAEAPDMNTKDQWAKIQSELFEIMRKEGPELQKLRDAQMKFANEVSMKIMLMPK